MKNVGWIKLHRKMLDWSLCDTPSAFNLYCHLLLMASYEDCTFKGVLLQRGQLFTTIKKLEVVTGLSTKAIRNALSLLEDEGCIKCIGANKGHTITICNFDNYQADEEAQGQTKGMLKDTSKGTSKDTLKGTMKGQTPIYNVCKEDKEVEEEKENKEKEEVRENNARTHEAEILCEWEFIFTAFRDFYEKKLNNVYTPSGNESQCAEELMNKFRLFRDATGFRATEKIELYAFKSFIWLAYETADQWQKAHFNIKVLNSQFNTFKNQIINGGNNNGKNNNGRESMQDLVNEANRRMAKYNKPL